MYKRQAEILLSHRIVNAHKSIPAIPAFDFSRQPCMGGDVYKRQIREGVKFSDGSDFTTDDVIFSLDKMNEDPMLTLSLIHISFCQFPAQLEVKRSSCTPGWDVLSENRR